MKKLTILILTLVVVGGAVALWPSKSDAPINDDAVMCTMEAKLCPDGSYVGRSGPKCEFAKCPEVKISTNGDLTLRVGQQGKVGDLSLTFNKVNADSRCPIDVQCIWAGEVKAEVVLTGKSGSETVNISSGGSSHLFDGHQISIIAVSPPHESQKTISTGDYKITFHVVVTSKTPPIEALLKGTITLSPTCPVERMPPDPACAPKPYQTTVKVFTADGTELVKTAQSQSDGNFSVVLPYGDYSIVAGGGKVLPRCEAVTVSLKTPNSTSIAISCDTGIR